MGSSPTADRLPQLNMRFMNRKVSLYSSGYFVLMNGLVYKTKPTMLLIYSYFSSRLLSVRPAQGSSGTVSGGTSTLSPLGILADNRRGPAFDLAVSTADVETKCFGSYRVPQASCLSARVYDDLL